MTDDLNLRSRVEKFYFDGNTVQEVIETLAEFLVTHGQYGIPCVDCSYGYGQDVMEIHYKSPATEQELRQEALLAKSREDNERKEFERLKKKYE